MIHYVSRMQPAFKVGLVARWVMLLLVASSLAACATRPVNPPVKSVADDKMYSFERKGQNEAQAKTLVALAFSGGGTRAAAFSYGVLETLNRTEFVNSNGKKSRMIDHVDVITGVSGGSFTALAYGLYGDKLFDQYEQKFLKRNVQSELIARSLNPINWGYLSSTGWGRSELAADLYDEILFDGATFADLDRKDGPVIAVSATDLATGSRIMFTHSNFDAMCTDLGAFRLSRAAAASSAVPVVLSPLTINNYGGSCGKRMPLWFTPFLNTKNPPRPAARTLERIQELNALMNGGEPYLHLVDGGISDNLGLRGGLDVFNWMEALREAGHTTPFDHVQQIVVVVVNSVSTPKTDWNKSEDPPGTIPILMKAAGVPIDRYSNEQIEYLRDIEARWNAMRSLRDLPAIQRISKKNSNAALEAVRKVPNAKIYTINVSFAGVPDPNERDYLNQLPTSFVLPDEAVDRLRAAAGAALLNSPDFQQLLSDVHARIVEEPTTPHFQNAPEHQEKSPVNIDPGS